MLDGKRDKRFKSLFLNLYYQSLARHLRIGKFFFGLCQKDALVIVSSRIVTYEQAFRFGLSGYLSGLSGCAVAGFAGTGQSIVGKSGFVEKEVYPRMASAIDGTGMVSEQ